MNTQDLERLMGEVTPGEWNASPGHEQRNGQRYWQVQNEFDAIMQNQFCWAQGSHEANARLIAMAPDLAREVIALRAKVAAAEQLVEAFRETSQALAWEYQGQRGGWADNLLPSSEALSNASAAIAAWDAAK